MDRTLSLLVKFAALDRLTAPLRSMSGGAKKAALEMAATRKEVVQLERSAARVAGFKKLSADIEKSQKAMEAARNRAAALQAAIAQATGPTAALTVQLTAQENKIARLTERTEGQVERLTEMREQLQGAGIDVNRLSDAERELAERLAAANRRLDTQTDRSARAAANAERLRRAGERGQQMQSMGGSALAIGGIVAAPMGLAVGEAITYESALANLRKVVKATPAEFAALDRSILDMSRRLPMTAANISTITAAFAQSGVDRAELLGFAEDAVKMGIAFDMTAEDAGTTMAAWKSAFAMGRRDVRALADQVNHLGNESGASAVNITDIVTRIGPLGSVGGLASGQIAALGATMNSMGIESEIAATGIKNTMLALTKGAAATKEQQAAFKALGLDARKVAADMQRDAAGTIMRVMGLMNKLPKARQAGLMTQLFGSESIAAIAPLLTQLPALAANFERVGNASRYAGSMDREYAGIASTSANKMQLMRNRIDALQITVGEKLLPRLVTATEKIGKLADRMSAWADENPRAASGLTMVVAGFAALATVLGVLGIALGFIWRPLVMVFGWIMRIGPVFGSLLGWLSRFRIVGVIVRIVMAALTAVAAFFGAPVWAVLAIAAGLAAAGLAIYNHWAWIKATFLGNLNWFLGLTRRFRESGMLLLGNLWQGMKSAFFTGIQWFASVHLQMGRIGVQLVLGLINGVGSMFGRLKDKIVGLGKSAIGWFKNVLGIHSPSRVFADLGGHMMGGLTLGLDRAAGRPLATVRDVGARLARTAAMTLAVGQPATAANPTGGTAPGGRSIGEVHIHIHAQAGQDANAIAKAVRAELERVMRADASASRSSYADQD